MYSKTFVRCACIAAIGMSSCTTESVLDRANPAPARMISFDLPLERDKPPEYPPPRACLLGSADSCMDLDPHPFETCLVSGKACETEGARVLPLKLTR